MPSCSRKEALAKLLFILVTNIIKLLFILVTNTIKFLFLFFYLFSIYFAKVFTYFFRYEDEYEDEVSNEDEEEEEHEKEEEKECRHYSQLEKEHLVADIVNDGDTLVFLPKNIQGVNKHIHIINNNYHVHSDSYESLFQDPIEEFDDETTVHFESSPTTSKFYTGSTNNDDIIISKINNVGYEVISEDYTSRSESNNLYESSSELVDHDQNNNHEGLPMFDEAPTKSQAFSETKTFGSQINIESIYHGENDEKIMNVIKKDEDFTKDEKFLIFDPRKSKVKKLLKDLEKEEEGIFEDTYTVGSTSKSSSDWRSSMRDSAITDDPFSSSSRRSCPKWESYAVYQKYDEEMMFLDRISAQKLHETESMRSFQVEPRSISQRIVHKLGHKNKRNSAEEEIYSKNKKNNPYNELEVAYVAQICLAWEALNWNYANFQRKHGNNSKPEQENDEDDDGCPAYIAQQFQQFEVLLQRYIENEPFQRGKRPEIYARMRADSPKLLHVPEYHDYEGEEREECVGRIGSAMFLKILEDAIQTFMKFLKADRETHCQLIMATLFKARSRGSIDPNLINVIKKQHNKMKFKLRDLQHTRSHICFKKRKIPKETKMEIMMGLIDLKIVSRVLRMADLTPEQIQWCEAKMGKLRILDGILLRDSSPLFFPAH